MYSVWIDIQMYVYVDDDDDGNRYEEKGVEIIRKGGLEITWIKQKNISHENELQANNNYKLYLLIIICYIINKWGQFIILK